MKHLIMGTAGHIDHGKTTLVKALTGIECDTHREEKARGITINLGFAHIDLPSGDTVGIVDVPGHKGFINTMVAGASGIDFALMVIAADSGVMPQTREHLQVMEVLGVRRGLIALTKTDLVDADVSELAAEEIAELVKGTFLENAPIIPVSGVTGDGLDQLREAIARQAEAAIERARGEVFRMFIDRIFTVTGFGTVVTGSVISGRISTGDNAFLLPPQKELRVRRLERYGSEVDEITAGDRASMNLVGLNREDFSRGMIVANTTLRGTKLVDAKLMLFEHGRRFGVWGQGIFLLGTYEAQVKFHVLDKDSIGSGDIALVQIHLPRPCIGQAGDRFVLRSSSSDITLGGGEIIDASPLHHRRRREELIQTLSRIAEGKLPELVAMEVRKRYSAVSHKTIADALNISEREVAESIENGTGEDIRVFEDDSVYYLIVKKQYGQLASAATKNIAAFHRRNPLEKGGRSVEELLGVLGIEPHSDGHAFVRILLKTLGNEGVLKPVGHTWAMVGHEVSIDDGLRKDIEIVEEYFRDRGMKTPLVSELEELAKTREIDDRRLSQIIRYLNGRRSIYTVEGSHLHAGVVDPIRKKVLEYLCSHPEGLTVAKFRDLVSGNRKICLLLFALFDKEGVTERQDDVRVITDEGREFLESA